MKVNVNDYLNFFCLLHFAHYCLFNRNVSVLNCKHPCILHTFSFYTLENNLHNCCNGLLFVDVVEVKNEYYVIFLFILNKFGSKLSSKQSTLHLFHHLVCRQTIANSLQFKAKSKAKGIFHCLTEDGHYSFQFFTFCNFMLKAVLRSVYSSHC